MRFISSNGSSVKQRMRVRENTTLEFGLTQLFVAAFKAWPTSLHALVIPSCPSQCALPSSSLPPTTSLLTTVTRQHRLQTQKRYSTTAHWRWRIMKNFLKAWGKKGLIEDEDVASRLWSVSACEMWAQREKGDGGWLADFVCSPN